MTNERLSPSRFSDRYYPLSELARLMRRVARQYAVDKGIVVDYGCGTMPYRSLWTTSQYVGVDFASNPLADMHLTDDFKVSLPDAYADVVMSTQVLEHVESPSEYLAECKRLLKPGGITVLSTHGYWIYHPSPHDYWRWTSAGLQKVLREAGFEILDFSGVMGLLPSSLQLMQDSVLHKIPALIRPLWSIFMQTGIAFTDRFYSDASRAVESSLYVAVLTSKP